MIVRKLSGFVPISSELLADLRAHHRPPTREEQARREWERAALTARLARHARLLAVTTGPRRELIEMHGPERSGAWLTGYACGGCEFGGPESEPPEWPCSTWVVAAEGDW